MPFGPYSSSAELDGLAKSSNAFAFDLFAALRAQQGNLALSPFSISTALTMTWAGARGETAAQMKSVLHLDGAPEEALNVARQLVATPGDPGQRVILSVANRLFGDAAYDFEPTYLDLTRAAFGAALEPLDFQHAAEQSRERINAWVAERTGGRIQNLLPWGSVKPDTRLVLTNAIYFLGDWLTPFDVSLTRPARFHLSPSRAEEVPTMNQTDVFLYGATGRVKLLQLPYRGGELAMTLVLPNEIDGLDALEQRLSPAAFAAWLGAAQPEQVVVGVPKFKIDPTDSLRLSEMLRTLGMPLAFDRDRADFTGLANPLAAEDRLCIDEVFHKALVKLDEKGTEAAAATADSKPGSSKRGQERPQEFRADHPFLFFLQHVRSGLILFMGRVTDPGR